jgi:hypothetical protein
VARSRGTTKHNTSKSLNAPLLPHGGKQKDQEDDEGGDKCPIHPKLRHTLFDCVTIRKSLNAPLLPHGGKQRDQEDDEGGDKLGAQHF